MQTKYFISGPNASCTIKFDDLLTHRQQQRSIEKLIKEFCYCNGDDQSDYTATNLTKLENKMPEIKRQVAYQVDIVEYERGWGSKVDERKFFDNEAEAKKFVKDYNEKYNNKPVVPDWYMIAMYQGMV